MQTTVPDVVLSVERMGTVNSGWADILNVEWGG